MAHPTTKKKADKPEKPTPDFPLFAHATRRWAKKIRGKMCYFGPWEDPQGALNKYLEQMVDLHAGRTPKVSGDGFTVRDLLNRFLTAKQRALDANEITARTFGEYHATGENIKDAFGLTRLVSDLTPEDFEKLRERLAKRLGPVALGNEIQRVRTVFKYGFESALIAVAVRYGPTFKKPSKKVMRKARAGRGPRMFEAEDIRRMLEAAGHPLKAMILLGVNCGFGNADCGQLPLSALDLTNGWCNFPRPKTGIERRVPLWPETTKALREAIKARPEPKDAENAGLAFLTRWGLPWYKDAPDSPISKEMAKLLRELSLNRDGLNFYALRHTFETVGGEARDQVAVDAIMGHAREDMASVYREKVSDERLIAVTEHVRQWLFGEEKKSKGKGSAGKAAQG